MHLDSKSLHSQMGATYAHSLALTHIHTRYHVVASSIPHTHSHSALLFNCCGGREVNLSNRGECREEEARRG